MGENIWIFVPIMGMSIPIFAIWMKHREAVERHRANTAIQQPAGLAPQHAEQLRALEDRVRVLERIVTDGGFNVAAQIEALRDPADSGTPLNLHRKERA